MILIIDSNYKICMITLIKCNNLHARFMQYLDIAFWNMYYKQVSMPFGKELGNRSMNLSNAMTKRCLAPKKLITHQLMSIR